MRGLWGCYRAVASLARRGEIDFVVVTIPSNFLAPVGRLVGRRFGLPYGIDYQDPWIHRWPGVDRPFSRAWGSYRLSCLLEPWAVRDAALITGMAPGYVSGMLERNPRVAERAVVACMAMGSAPEDFQLVHALHRETFLFRPGDGAFHMIYAGALLPSGMIVLDAFLAGLGELRARSPELAARLRVHFVGTGTSPDDPRGHRVLPRARQAGVEAMVEEHPQRIGYIDALNHQEQSDAVLVLGSTEAHYTPSKVFQAILSRRPVFALLHESSTAVIEAERAGIALTLTAARMPSPTAIATALATLLAQRSRTVGELDQNAFEPYSARESARALAKALDTATDRARRPAGT
jgi:hypothetical protein